MDMGLTYDDVWSALSVALDAGEHFAVRVAAPWKELYEDVVEGSQYHAATTASATAEICQAIHSYFTNDDTEERSENTEETAAVVEASQGKFDDSNVDAKPVEEALPVSPLVLPSSMEKQIGGPRLDKFDGDELETISEDVPRAHCGDIVLLSSGSGVPSQYRCSPAIVTRVAEAHCTVIVLEANRQFGLGECWPAWHDISIETCKLRLGTRVVIDGMQGARLKHLNGLTGTISEHPREGHPMFLRKPSSPEQAQLRVCVTLDDSATAGVRSAILEPQFLTSFDDVALQKLETLEALKSLLAKAA